MTNEYLDRTMVLESLEIALKDIVRTDREDYIVATAIQTIRDVPAADVEPVRHGHWTGEGDGYADGEMVYDIWKCSECGYAIDDGTDNPEMLPEYCAGCGTKMDGAAEATGDGRHRLRERFYSAEN